MGNSITRSYMCCSIRDKYLGTLDGVMLQRPPQFHWAEVGVEIEEAQFMAFAPLYQREAQVTRRIALASSHEVQVYKVLNEWDTISDLQLSLTHTLKLDAGLKVVGLLFLEEDSSNHVVCALSSTQAGGGSFVRVWSCAMPGLVPLIGKKEEKASPVEWTLDGVCVAKLDEHRASIEHIATSRTYLLTADATGECRVWQKGKEYARRAAAVLHPGGVADLCADRLFAYSAGREDKQICAWSLPDMQLTLTIAAEIPESMLHGLVPLDIKAQEEPSPGQPDPASSPRGGKGVLGRVSMLCRPMSRWAGWLGSGRHMSLPRGSLVVAAEIGERCELAGAGAGMLMEWSLGEKPTCQSVQVAHDSPIVALAYGPYDNGPLISADSKGVFRIWETMLECGLCLSEQIELRGLGQQPGAGGPLVAVEQPRSLWVSVGSKRLYVWQRQDSNYP